MLGDKREIGCGDTIEMMQAAGSSAERPLRVGVVGVGGMGSNHARVFAGLPGTGWSASHRPQAG